MTTSTKTPRRVARLIATIALFSVLGVVLLVTVALLSINLPPVSRFVAARVNSALAPTFRGQLELQRLGHVDLGGVEGAELTVKDPGGRTVLEARDIDVRLAVPSVVYGALFGGDTLQIPIERIEVESVSATLIDDGTGTPTLASAFEPRERQLETETGGGTALRIDMIAVRTIEVRGELASPGPIDVDLKDLEARLASEPRGLSLSVSELAIEARQVPVVERVRGRLTADVFMPAEPARAEPRSPAAEGEPNARARDVSTTSYALNPTPEEQRVRATFDGDVGGSSITLAAALLGERVDATLELPSIEPSTLQKLSPELAPKSASSLSAKLEGALDALTFRAEWKQGAARLEARGRVEGEEDRRIDARVNAANVNLAQLLREGPVTSIDLAVDTDLKLGERGGTGRYRVSTAGSSFEGKALPDVLVAGDVELPSEEPVLTRGTLDVTEPGANTRVEYYIRSQPDGVVAKVGAKTQLDRPERLRALTGVTALGELQLEARYDGLADRVDAHLEGQLRNVAHAQGTARRLDAKLTLGGPASEPVLSMLVTGRGVATQGRAFSTLRLSAGGTPERIDVVGSAAGKDPEWLELRATITPNAEPLLTRPVLRVKNRGHALRVAARGVSVGAERVRVDQLSLTGPGRAEASLVFGEQLERLSLRTEQLEVARVLAALGIRSELRSAILDIVANVETRGRKPQGHLSGDISKIQFGSLAASAHADLSLERGKVSGTAGLTLGRGGKTEISLSGFRIPDDPAAGIDLEDATGDVKVTGDLDLARAQALLPLLGVERGEGRVRYDVELKPAPAGGSPVLRAHLESRGLVLIGERADTEQEPTPSEARESTPWTLRGIDLALDASLEDQKAQAKGRLFDAAGDLLTFDAGLTGVEGTPDLTNPRALMRLPLRAAVRIPKRDLEKLPATIRPQDIEGLLALELDAEGTLADPRVRARATVDRFAPATNRRHRLALDLALDAEYDRRGGKLAMSAEKQSFAVFNVDSKWQGDLAALPAHTEGKSPVRLDMNARLDDFPVQIVPALRERHVRGDLSGNARLQGLGTDAQFELDLKTDGLKIDELTVDSLAANVRALGGKLSLRADIDGKGGRAHAQLETGLAWGDRLVPEVDQQLEGKLHSERLRLSALLPLVDESVSELDGELDADFTARIAGGMPRIEGRATLAKGVVQVPSIGQRFHDLQGEVTISPGSVVIDKVRGRGVSGGFEAEAKAQLDGLTPIAANAEMRIKEDDKLPLTLEGEAIGDAWGTIEMSYRHDEAAKLNDVRVNVTRLHIELPAAPPGGIQSLDQPEHIRVGYHRRDGDFVPVPLQPLEEPSPPSEYQTIVTVELGSVAVEKGEQANVVLQGKIKADVGQELDVRGKVETRRGKLDVSGKEFDIERGTITFTGGEPSDPIISAVARYDSPAGYTVYAEYTGTAERGKLTLRSEPALSQDEILTLLMFGTPDGSFGAGSGDNLSTAVSVAGSTAAQGLNAAISDITDLDVSARVDTSTGAPRPELVVQLTPRVTARVSQALGEPAPGQSPDRTFLTVDLRLGGTWSLSTTIGDRGASALDLIWRKRY